MRAARVIAADSSLRPPVPHHTDGSLVQPVPMHIVTVGDVVLDVLVETASALRRDDDTDARIRLTAGGQAANVAAWAAALGAEATVVGPQAPTAATAILSAELAEAGVRWQPVAAERQGSVVAWVSPTARTLASDPGDLSWTSRLDLEAVPASADRLHLSGYPLLRAADPTPLLAYCVASRRAGASLSVDLSSATLVAAYGERRLAAVLDELSPEVVFATAAEAQGGRRGAVRTARRPGGQARIRRRHRASRRSHPPFSGCFPRRCGTGARPDRRWRRAGSRLSGRRHRYCPGRRGALRPPVRRRTGTELTDSAATAAARHPATLAASLAGVGVREHGLASPRRVALHELGSEAGELGLDGVRFDDLHGGAPARERLSNRQGHRCRHPDPDAPIVESLQRVAVPAELGAQDR